MLNDWRRSSPGSENSCQNDVWFFNLVFGDIILSENILFTHIELKLCNFTRPNKKYKNLWASASCYDFQGSQILHLISFKRWIFSLNKEQKKIILTFISTEIKMFVTFHVTREFWGQNVSIFTRLYLENEKYFEKQFRTKVFWQ